MRVLLAIDGSVSSDRARDLVSDVPWPEGTLIRVVAASDHGPELAARTLEGPGRGVETFLPRGRAASAIVEEATGFRADLVVLGSRGHGQLETMLLGSVSAEVVDHAPCPVLIARGSHLRSILFADDGSEGAAEAAELIAEWPIFAGLRVTVFGASEVAIPWSAGMAPGL